MIEHIAILASAVALIVGVVSVLRARLLDKRQKMMVHELRYLIEKRGFRDLPISEWAEWMSSREFRKLSSVWRHVAGFPDIGNLPEPAQKAKVFLARKKESIQKMGPKTFYYLDQNQVKDLYSQAFQELQPKQIETQESRKSEKGISADLKLISPKYDTAKATDTKKTYEPELTPAVMYNKVEEYLIDKGEVSFGLEDFDYDETSIDEFKSMCRQMKGKFNFDVPGDLQKQFISDKLRGIALDRIKEISQCSGYVAMQDEFSVAEVDDNCRVMIFGHPLNCYLSEKDNKVSIKILCDSENLPSSGSSTFTQGSSVKITCFGKVVRWNDSDAALTINPIAIY